MKKTRKKVDSRTEKEKVEERREEVLARGRKFKYPLQWTRYRIVINTLVIALVVFALLIISGYLALYRLGMTGELLYRITKYVPASVAVVDSESVRFSDYLMFYRSSILSIERQSGGQFENISVDYLYDEYKRAALLEAEKYTYALKLARELDITVSDEEVAKEFDRHLKIGGVDRSEEGFLKTIEDNFGLTKSEYERMLYLTLMKAKVEMVIDEKANNTAKKVEDLLASNGNSYGGVVDELGSSIIYEETGGLVDSKNIDGGRASEAIRLEPGQSSGKFVSMNGDGYYFVKLIKKTETEVNFVSIKIPFTEFDKRFNALKDEDKIKSYININDPNDNKPINGEMNQPE